MIEAMLMIAMVEAKYTQDRDEQWSRRYLAADPEMRKIMFTQREEEKKEREIERRHREQIRAQEKVAEAIRFAAIMRS